MLVLIVMFIALFSILWYIHDVNEKAQEQACKSIGYDAHGVGDADYCVSKEGKSQKVIFKNCYKKCDVYKID